MHIKEIQIMKANAEVAISDELRNFCEQTDLELESCEVKIERLYDADGKSKVANIETEIGVNL